MSPPLATTERDRPHEWLRAVVEGAEYEWLLEDSGSLAVAAYRLARARCRVQPVPSAVPTATEVCAAARMIVDALGAPRDSTPPPATLLDECEQGGLSVIVPIESPRRGRRRAA